VIAALTNPVWASLTTNHRVHADGTSKALRYPRDIAPFAAVVHAGGDALRDLGSLLDLNEDVWLVGPLVRDAPGLRIIGEADCLQFVMPLTVASPPRTGRRIVGLSGADAADMVNLIVPRISRRGSMWPRQTPQPSGCTDRWGSSSTGRFARPVSRECPTERSLRPAIHNTQGSPERSGEPVSACPG
jgi:hypothetical protein